MGKSRDSQRTGAVSTSPKRRKRPSTTIRDSSSDEDTQMELTETAKLIDKKKGKRRIVNTNRIVEWSDEEYVEDDGETRTEQLPKNRRSRTRSSAVAENKVDEVIGGPIPRRTRSAKRVQEHRNSGTSSGTGENPRRRKSAPAPEMRSPTSSGVPKKKKKYVSLNSNSPSIVQDDIEIEVAEALYDLMTLSHSRTQSSDRDGKVYRDGTKAVDDGELRRLQPGLGKVDNAVFKVQNKESINANADITLSESTNNKGGENDELRDEPNQESLGAGFADRGKARFPKAGEPSPRVRRNACDIQDPTATKEDYASIVAEARKKKAPMELPSLLDIDPEVTTHDVQKKSETPSGVMDRYRLTLLSLEKKTRHDDIDGSNSQQSMGRTETNIQSPTPLSFPTGMGSRARVIPRPGYTSFKDRSPMILQTPQFKPVTSRTKRCITHKYIADNIYHHQKLLAKSMLSSSMHGNNASSSKTTASTKRDKNSNVNASGDVTGCPPLQQASTQAPAPNLPRSGFTLAPGYRQTTMMGMANSSFPEGSSSTAATFNQYRPIFASNEAAASYMAMLQSGDRRMPPPTNTSLPSFNGGQPMMNIGQIRRPPVHRGRVPPNVGSSTHLPHPEENNNNGGNNRVEPPPQRFPSPYSQAFSSMANNQTHSDPFLVSFYIQQKQKLKMGGSSAVQTGYSSYLSKLDNFNRSASFRQARMNSVLQMKRSQEQNRNTTQPGAEAASPLIVGEGSSASTAQNGESNPACGRAAQSVLSNGGNQASEMREG